MMHHDTDERLQTNNMLRRSNNACQMCRGEDAQQYQADLDSPFRNSIEYHFKVQLHESCRVVPLCAPCIETLRAWSNVFLEARRNIKPLCVNPITDRPGTMLVQEISQLRDLLKNTMERQCRDPLETVPWDHGDELAPVSQEVDDMAQFHASSKETGGQVSQLKSQILRSTANIQPCSVRISKLQERSSTYVTPVERQTCGTELDSIKQQRHDDFPHPKEIHLQQVDVSTPIATQTLDTSVLRRGRGRPRKVSLLPAGITIPLKLKLPVATGLPRTFPCITPIKSKSASTSRYSQTTNYQQHDTQVTKTPSESADPRCECHICRKTFSTPFYLQLHIRRVHDTSQYFACTYCQYGSQLKHYFLAHMQNYHPDVYPFCCHACGRVLSSRTCLKRHMYEVHIQTTRFSCSHCAVSFKRKQALMRHVTMHIKQEAENGKDMKIDMKVPSVKLKLKYISCKTCEYKSTDKYEVRAHVIAVHQRKIPQRCSDCGYVTAQNCDMKRHRATHTGEWIHTCDYCGYGAGTIHDVKTHMKKNHEDGQEAPFHCHLCNASFKYENSRKSHMSTCVQRERKGIN